VAAGDVGANGVVATFGIACGAAGAGAITTAAAGFVIGLGVAVGITAGALAGALGSAVCGAGAGFAGGAAWITGVGAGVTCASEVSTPAGVTATVGTVGAAVPAT